MIEEKELTVALIADLAALIHPIGPIKLPCFFSKQPDSQTVKTQLATSQHHRTTAEVINTSGFREDHGSCINRLQLLGKPPRIIPLGDQTILQLGAQPRVLLEGGAPAFRQVSHFPKC